MSTLSKRHRRRSSPGEARPFDGMSTINPHAAGIDMGAHAIMACVPDGADHQLGRAFGTSTADLDAVADWCVDRGIQTAAMESTGGYVRRITACAISLAEGTGSGGNPWVNDLPGGESQRGQEHVGKAERPRSRVWPGSARPVC